MGGEKGGWQVTGRWWMAHLQKSSWTDVGEDKLAAFTSQVVKFRSSSLHCGGEACAP